jgi:hypothetical protein
VTRHTFTETESPEDAQRAGEFLFAFGALFLDAAGGLWPDINEVFWCEWNAVDRLRGGVMFSDGHVLKATQLTTTGAARSLKNA